jgi:epoxyqueuosine reductase
MPSRSLQPFLNSAAYPASAVRLSREIVRAQALEAGLAEAGLTALPYASQEQNAERFEAWARTGRSGTMNYLKRTNEAGQLLRSRVEIPFPWARSAVVCWASYNRRQPHSTDPAAEGTGSIARYARSGKADSSGALRPSDYHKVLKKRMQAVEARLHEQFGTFEARAFVDTGPLAERELAEAAGLGWRGKNTCLIHPRLGSLGFLAVLLTSLEAEKEEAATTPGDHCGSCRRCLEACPTGALITPHQMDATRCIAYLTIEHKGAIAPERMERMGRQVFGCDLCQEVCPWNRSVPESADPELEPRTELANPALEWLAAMDEAAFEKEFNGSPVRRAGFWGFRRNVAIAMGNSGLKRFRPRLEEWAGAADEGLSTAARWALGKLESRSLY